MLESRKVETTQGIQQELTVQDFDRMARRHVEKGYTDIKGLLQAGITSGSGLEIGPGPGYMGLEWLKATNSTTLTGLEISAEMIKMAAGNTAEYGFEDRVKYMHGDATKAFPFEDNSFDITFSFSSLHEWEKPENVFNEMFRVLKPSGILFISDMRRDVSALYRFIMRSSVKEKLMKIGFDTSLAAAYTVDEIKHVLAKTKWEHIDVLPNRFGLAIKGMK